MVRLVRHSSLSAYLWVPAPPLLSLKNQGLVAECEDLGFQVGATANDVPDATGWGDQSSDHRSTLAQLHAEGKLLASQPRMEFSEGTTTPPGPRAVAAYSNLLTTGEASQQKPFDAYCFVV